MSNQEELIRKIFRNEESTPQRIFLQLGIYESEYILYQSRLATTLDMSITTLNYWITKFKVAGLINKDLTLTDKGRKIFKYLWENLDKTELRAHNIQIIFKVSHCPRDFPNCFSTKVYTPINNGRYSGIKIELNECTCMFYSPEKIVCVLRNIYANDEDEISSIIQLLIPDLKKALEIEFEGIILGDDYELANIQTMHIAILNSIIAKKQLLKGFVIEDENYTIDNSNGTPELEITNPEIALLKIPELLKVERAVSQ